MTGIVQSLITLVSASEIWLGTASGASVQVCKAQAAPIVNANAMAAAATTVLSLASSLNQRNIYMKDVAGFKYKTRKPVEDLPQEERVMNKAVTNASSEGLDADSVRPYIQAQMDVAKNIQKVFIAGWEKTPEPGYVPPEDLEKTRALVAAEDVKIIKFINQQLKLGGFCEQHRMQIYSKLTARHMTDADKKLLVDTLFRVRLKAAQ